MRILKAAPALIAGPILSACVPPLIGEPGSGDCVEIDDADLLGVWKVLDGEGWSGGEGQGGGSYFVDGRYNEPDWVPIRSAAVRASAAGIEIIWIRFTDTAERRVLTLAYDADRRTFAGQPLDIACEWRGSGRITLGDRLRDEAAGRINLSFHEDGHDLDVVYVDGTTLQGIRLHLRRSRCGFFRDQWCLRESAISFE